MTLGRVIGSVVSTAKLTVLEGYKILMIRPVDPQGRDAGDVTLALDSVQAGVGDTVLVEKAGELGANGLILGPPSKGTRRNVGDSAC